MTQNHRKYDKEKAKNLYYRSRIGALEIYGAQCAWCGNKDDLEFDHIDNNGEAHRLIEHSFEMLRRICKRGKLLDFRLQILCRRCHKFKTFKRGVYNLINTIDRVKIMNESVAYLCWNCRSPLADYGEDFYCHTCIMVVKAERALMKRDHGKTKLA